MRRRLSSLLLAALVASTLPAVATGAAADDHVGADLVVSQVYGGGGNSGAQFTHDFVEVFNRGDAPVDLSGLSIQYASATGTGNFGANSGQLTELPNVTLQPGQYYLVQQAGGTAGVPLPTPDLVDPTPINLAAGSGKVALVTGTDSLGCNGGSAPCSAEQLARIIDLVGYGTANFFEGSATAPLLSNTTAGLRDDDGCTDTDDNAADFTAGAPTPRNTASPTNPCGSPEPTGPVPVISQIYGAGGNSGATLNADYVELFNAGDSAFELAGTSLQYGSATGNFGSSAGLITELQGTIGAGEYFLVQMAGGANGDPLPVTADQTNTSTNLATANGKVALVDQTAALGCGATATPCSSEQLEPVLDLVGFGTANTFEGTAPAPAPSATTAIFRADDGCTDTDDNAADFSTAAPAPRNSDSPTNLCSGGGTPTNQPVVAECSDLTVVEGQAGSVTQTASDADGTVTDVTITDGAVDGISLGAVTPATQVGGTLSVDVLAADDLAVGTYDLELTFTNDDTEPQSATCDVTVSVQGDLCDVPVEDVTLINEIQGAGATTPLAGQSVVTRGVVTADFTSGGESGIAANQGLRGFFIEAIAADRDEDPNTSEGLFVFDGSGTFSPEIGTLVHVEGTAGEAFDVTQVSADRIALCDDAPGDLPPAATLPLPTPVDQRNAVFEPLESMRVTHPELTVVEFFQIERFGEIRLSSGGVLQNPTNVVDPDDDAAYNALVEFNAANNIILDDGRTGQNLDPLPYVTPGDTLRIGDQAIDETFVLHYAFSAWRLQPVSIDELTEEFRTNRTRPRPETPPEVGGTLKVASFNVLNYFNGDGYFIGDDPQTAAGFPTARGARNVGEFERQTEKIVDAIIRMDADIVGLIEIENDAGDRQAAAALVDAVNTTMGDEVYDYLDTGVIGTDEIKLAYIYKPSTVELSGDYAILDSSVDPRFEDTRSRPALAQTFTEIATGGSVTITVNHLKSKGSACLAADNDPRQGNCNGVRERAAFALADWLATDPTGVESSGNLIIGDLNAYAKEDPIVALQDAGYIDLLDAFSPEGVMPYTYTFDATQGYLDHALADQELFPYVTGAAAWNINADEVPAIDYQLSGPGSFRTAEVAELFYDDSAFRSSDHDPVLVGLDLAPNTPPTVDDLTVRIRERSTYDGQVVADDADGDPLSYTFSDAVNGTLTPGTDGAFTYTPNAWFRGIEIITVTVDDGRGGTAEGTITITVRNGQAGGSGGGPGGNGPPGQGR